MAEKRGWTSGRGIGMLIVVLVVASSPLLAAVAPTASAATTTDVVLRPTSEIAAPQEATTPTGVAMEAHNQTGDIYTGASFQATIIGDNTGPAETGDLVKVTVNYTRDPDSLPDDTPLQTTVTIGGPSTRVLEAVRVVDTDRDGKATFTINTYTFGNATVVGTQATGLLELDTSDTYRVAGDSVAGVPEDGDPADTIEAFRVTEAFIMTTGDQPAFDLSSSLAGPPEAGEYPLRTHNLSALSDTDQYSMRLQDVFNLTNNGSELTYPHESDTARLVLRTRELRGFIQHVVASGDTTGIDDIEDIEAGLENASNEIPAITTLGTTGGTIAAGDTLLLQINAEGLGGQFENLGDVRNGFLGRQGMYLYIEEQTPPPNREPFYVDLDGRGVELISDAHDDRFFLKIDTERVGDADRDFFGGSGMPVGEYQATLVRVGGSFADFFEEGNFPSEVGVSTLFPASSGNDPYLDQNEQQQISTKFEIVDETEREEVSLRLRPSNVSVRPGETVTYAVTANTTGGGVGAYNITVAVTDPAIARITNATVSINGTAETQVSNAEAQLGGFNGNTPNTEEITIGTVSLTGSSAGQAGVILSLGAISDESGNRYIARLVGSAQIEVREVAPDVTGDGNPATDPDGDGLYEDVNGDGTATPGDATVLFNAVFSGNPAVSNNPELFDFNEDGSVTPGDATVLFNEVF